MNYFHKKPPLKNDQHIERYANDPLINVNHVWIYFLYGPEIAILYPLGVFSFYEYILEREREKERFLLCPSPGMSVRLSVCVSVTSKAT